MANFLPDMGENEIHDIVRGVMLNAAVVKGW